MVQLILVLLRLFYRPSINRHLKSVLVGRAKSKTDSGESRFSAAEYRVVVKDTWDRYSRLSGEIPRVANLGGRMNLHLACLTLCAFQSLLKMDVDRTEAINIVSDATWKAYQRWGAMAFIVSSILTRDKVRRIQFATKVFQMFPFSSPAYKIERIIRYNGVDLNVRRCVVAEYFVSHDASDLCSSSWCDLDFPLAKLWGGRLERTQTLVKGNDLCDFRFRAGPGDSRSDLRNARNAR